ncbi:MAG: hypothetical protein ACFCUE_13245 [Candidatus Bathyarchaeia archaeon]
MTFKCIIALTVFLVTSNFEVPFKDTVITSQCMLRGMRKPLPLTNIDEDLQIDSDLAKRLAKAFAILKDIEE